MPGPVLVGRKAELERLLKYIHSAPLRSIVVVTGPSGIGKTLLARKAAHELGRKGYLALHLSVDRELRSPEDLYTALSSGLRYVEGVHLPGPRDLYGFLRKMLAAFLGTAATNGLGSDVSLFPEALRDTLNRLARAAVERGAKGIVLFIDNAQNFVDVLSPDQLRSVVKTLTDLQEDVSRAVYGGLQVILVMNGYALPRLLRSSPSPEYIEVFYLGEMTREDALSLYKVLRGREPRNSDALLIDGAVGGHPAHLALIAKRGIVGALCWYVGRVKQLVAEHLADLNEELRGVAENALRLIVERPLPSTNAPLGSLEGLIRCGVLQQGCSTYLGVYRWNSDCGSDSDERYGCGGGGWCSSLDAIAPSSRLSRIGIMLALDMIDSVPPFIVEMCSAAVQAPLAS